MSRTDWKRGRFSVGFEDRAIAAGLRGWQSSTGDFLDYWRFERDESSSDPVYDEGTGGGKVYLGPIQLPCLHVVHTQGSGLAGETMGFYSTDTLAATLSFVQFERTGLAIPDLRNERYLRDRATYDEKVFRITRISILGQIQRADLIIGLEGLQVNADELADDAQFQPYAVDPDDHNTSG